MLLYAVTTYVQKISYTVLLWGETSSEFFGNSLSSIAHLDDFQRLHIPIFKKNWTSTTNLCVLAHWFFSILKFRIWLFELLVHRRKPSILLFLPYVACLNSLIPSRNTMNNYQLCIIVSLSLIVFFLNHLGAEVMVSIFRAGVNSVFRLIRLCAHSYYPAPIFVSLVHFHH